MRESAEEGSAGDGSAGPPARASFVQVLIPARREDVKAEAGRAGLLAGEECLERGHVYPRKGQRQAGRVCWAQLCAWAGLSPNVGAGLAYSGVLQRTGWGHWATVARAGGPLLMQGTGLVSLPWSWEGGERGKTGDSEAVSSFSGAWVAVEGQVLVFAGKLNGHHERMLRIKAVTPAATSCTLLCTKQCYQLFASYGPSSTGQWRR